MDLDDVIEESKQYSDHGQVSGQAVLTRPPKIHLFESLKTYPWECDASFATDYIALLGVPRDQIPSISYCIRVKSKKGIIIKMYIQDSISKFVRKEYRIGDNIHLWTRWIFVNHSDKKPYFVVNAIGDKI